MSKRESCRLALCNPFHTPSLLHRYGPQAERHLIALAQDENQPLSLRQSLAFLMNPEDEDHIYYMWRVYSLMQGDSLDKWEIKTFYMYLPRHQHRIHTHAVAAICPTSLFSLSAITLHNRLHMHSLWIPPTVPPPTSSSSSSSKRRRSPPPAASSSSQSKLPKTGEAEGSYRKAGLGGRHKDSLSEEEEVACLHHVPFHGVTRRPGCFGRHHFYTNC